MEQTPLLDALLHFSEENGLRMHMPGHKGKALPMEGKIKSVAQIDYTELGPTGNLFDGDGTIRAAEDLWAKTLGMEQCLFLTGGSTEGLHAALTAACRPGEEILLDRNCHRAVFNSAALLDLRPVYLLRTWREDMGILDAVTPETVENAMKTHPNVKTVCITSPTYYGVLSNIPEISRVVKAHGGKLIVDGAHGPHLFFLGETGLNAADLLVLSAHKTLPAMGQTALLMANGFSHQNLRRAAALYGSSSPSYVMMASLDAARAYLCGEGTEKYRKTAEAVASLREKFPSVKSEGGLKLDPTRLVLLAKDGFAAAKALEREGVWPEMADRGHVVLILTCEDGEEELARLEKALTKCENHWGKSEQADVGLPPEGVQNMTLRAARFSPVETVRLRNAEGRTAAEQIAPYPPGVPVVAPGEEITKKALAYLAKVGYNMEQEIEAVREFPFGEREEPV